MTSLVMGIPIALLLLLLFFVLFVAPIQDQLSALATADQVNFGNWISHRGHGETKWLTWLPNSFKQDGSDLYLFEAKDLCRCSKQDSTGKYEKQQQHGDITLLFTFLHHSFVCTLIKGSGLDVMFLGGDPSRLLQMAIQQLFHEVEGWGFPQIYESTSGYQSIRRHTHLNNPLHGRRMALWPTW